MAGPVARRVTMAIAALLAAAAVAWSAFPLDSGGRGTRLALIAAIVTGVLSVAQVGLSGVPMLAAQSLATATERMAERLLSGIRAAQWAEGMVVATLVLEALHPAPPWHTAALGIALLCYLLAVHLAETRSGPAVLRPQLPLIAAGVGLLALGVGAAAMPGLPTGTTSLLAGGLAVVAAVFVAALTLPGTRRNRR